MQIKEHRPEGTSLCSHLNFVLVYPTNIHPLLCMCPPLDCLCFTNTLAFATIPYRWSSRGCLGSLFGSSRSIDVLSDIGSIVEGSRTALDTLPNLLSCRRSRLSTNKGIDSCLQLSELALNEAALGESGAEEGSVDSNQDPGPLLEGNGGEKESPPEEDLENSNEAHGGIIVFLDELANRVG